jgi:hypothetical protein
LYVIGIFERHFGPSSGWLGADLAGLLGFQDRIGCILALLFCQHRLLT